MADLQINETQTTQAPNLSEHEQAMVNAVDAKEQQVNESLRTDIENAENAPPEEEERKLAGKYKSVEELEKAYAELETKLGQRDTPSEEDTESPTPNEAEEAVKEAGLDFSSLETEYDNNGQLSDASFKKLEQAGIPREAVDRYIQGQESINNGFADRVQSEVGGEQEYNAMVEWASNNLSTSEQTAFNSALDNEDSAKFAVQGLYSRFKTANPNLIGSNRTSGQSTSSGGFETKSEMIKAMGSHEYKTDSTYRARVQAKLAKSNF